MTTTQLTQLTYTMTGSIDASNAKQIQEDLLAFIRKTSNSHVIIDFQKVDFLDSAGLMALVAGYKEAKSLGKKFSIFGVSSSVRIIFEVSQLDRILGVRNDINDYCTDQQLVAA